MSNPRIIAGKARGMRLSAVPGDITRPVTDRVKESLFNIIGADILDATLLDLFGGTGSIGIEALSRGALLVRFVDLNRAAVDTIKKNLAYTRLEKSAEVFQADSFSYLKQKPDRQFDYVYVAPPQYKGFWQNTLDVLDQNAGWLAPDAWVIAQVDPVEYRKLQLSHFTEFDQRRYGSTLLVFYQ